MMDRATLTGRYLAEVARRGETAADLLAVMPATGMLATKYQKRYLPRPLFLGHAEAGRLNGDLQHIRAAMISLPDLLFDGDLAAFAKAVGLTGVQASAAIRTRAERVTEWVRADLYPDATGLRLLEFNMGSGVAGSDSGEICRAMLRYPLLRKFAREHRLHYVDTMQEQIRLIFSESGFKPDSYPMIALVDWPDHFEAIGAFLHKVARRWRGTGLDAHACHIGQLKVKGGRVWLRGRPVDIIFRIFLSEHLLQPGAAEVMDPVLDAAARGEVAIFTPIDGELYGSKMPLAMLSDHANRHLFSAAQLAAFDRLLPWTRMMRPGPVTLDDGSTVDLLDYALGHAGDLVLKPALLHGGSGVLPGWHPDTTEQMWRDRLAEAMGGPYVLQRRINVTPELCPGEDAQPVGWETTWGVFTFPEGFGGVFARAFPARTRQAVARAGTGLHIGCCLVERPPPAQA